jgi:hypothetical protein
LTFQVTTRIGKPYWPSSASIDGVGFAPDTGRRRILAAAALLVAVAVAGVLAALALGFGDGGPGCASAPQVIGTGSVPGGGQWSVEASTKANGGCEHRLLTVSFTPFGTPAGSWSTSRDILADNSFSEPPAVEALNESTAFSGIVGPRVAAVKVTFDSNASAVVHTRSAPRRLRRHSPWLGAFRFFVTFARPRERVQKVVLLDSKGKVILVVPRSSEGFFKASDPQDG